MERKHIKTFEDKTSELNISDVISRLFSEVEKEFNVKGFLFMTYRKESKVIEFYEVDENDEKVDRYLKRVDVSDLSEI